MSKKKPKSIKPKVESAPVHLHFSLRGLPDRSWLARPQSVDRLTEKLRGPAGDSLDWEEEPDELPFFTFPTLESTIVCVNLNHFQFLQVLKSDPSAPQEDSAPAQKMRIWLEGRANPKFLGAARPELLNFQSLLEGGNAFEQCVAWPDEEGRPVMVRLGEIVVLEYPADWGSAAEDIDIDSDDENLLDLDDETPF